MSDHLGVSDRRPEIELTVQDRDENNNLTGDWRYVSDDEVVAYLRRGVESGTIKGEVVESVSFAGIVGPDWEFSTWKPGTYIVIGPVSDGGEDRP